MNRTLKALVSMNCFLMTTSMSMVSMKDHGHISYLYEPLSSASLHYVTSAHCRCRAAVSVVNFGGLMSQDSSLDEISSLLRTLGFGKPYYFARMNEDLAAVC